jgi:hypothetical protein
MQKSILLAVSFTTLSALTAASYAQSDPAVSPASSSSGTSAIPRNDPNIAPAPSTSGTSVIPNSAYGGDATGSNDPYIRKRAKDAAAKAEYKANQRISKAQYQAEKKASGAERQAALQGQPPTRLQGPNTNEPGVSGESGE